MDSEERKRQFAILLETLLKKSCDGVQTKLAKKLGIRISRTSRWLAGEVDPINLEVLVFSRIASLQGCSTQELAQILGFTELTQNPPNKFRLLLEQILSNKTQDKLGTLLGVSQRTISSWLNPKANIVPAKISAGTMFVIAHEQRWELDDLLVYLDLKEDKTEKNLLFKVQSSLNELSFNEKLKLLAWLSDRIQQEITQDKFITNESAQLPQRVQREALPALSDRTLLIILDKEDLAIATNYASNLAIHLQLQPDNIQVTTIPKLPQSLDNIDVLVFDISTADSASIALIEEIDFKGNILVFADPDLSQEVIGRISNRVTEVLLKPIDWNELKARAYFS